MSSQRKTPSFEHRVLYIAHRSRLKQSTDSFIALKAKLLEPSGDGHEGIYCLENKMLDKTRLVIICVDNKKSLAHLISRKSIDLLIYDHRDFSSSCLKAIENLNTKLINLQKIWGKEAFFFFVENSPNHRFKIP